MAAKKKTTTKPKKHVRGECGCGAVQFEARAKLHDVVWCHCSKCQRWHGGPGPYTWLPRAALHFTKQDGLTWWRASKTVQRGFCKHCGSSLFWSDAQYPVISIAAGALVAPTGLKSASHIYVGSKPDWYVIKDGLPKRRED